MKAQFARGPNGLATLASVLVHEYLHREPDSGEHVHSPEFYEAFEDVLCSPYLNLFEIVVGTFERYQKARRKQGLTDTTTIAKGQDQIERALLQ